MRLLHEVVHNCVQIFCYSYIQLHYLFRRVTVNTAFTEAIYDYVSISSIVPFIDNFYHEQTQLPSSIVAGEQVCVTFDTDYSCSAGDTCEEEGGWYCPGGAIAASVQVDMI